MSKANTINIPKQSDICKQIKYPFRYFVNNSSSYILRLILLFEIHLHNKSRNVDISGLACCHVYLAML